MQLACVHHYVKHAKDIGLLLEWKSVARARHAYAYAYAELVTAVLTPVIKIPNVVVVLVVICAARNVGSW